jgi:hypothetical protein
MMRVLTAAIVTAGLTLAGCAPSYERNNQYRTFAAAARSGDMAAAYQIAERYADPDKFPDAQGWPDDMFEAAIWCDMIGIVKSDAPQNAQCAVLLKGVSPTILAAAQQTALVKYSTVYGLNTGR